MNIDLTFSKYKIFESEDHQINERHNLWLQIWEMTCFSFSLVVQLLMTEIYVNDDVCTTVHQRDKFLEVHFNDRSQRVTISKRIEEGF